MKPILLHPAAEEKLTEASAFYEQRRKGLGRELRDAVRVTARAIQRKPRLFPSHNHETRKAVLQRFPYSLYYVEESDFISIVAIAHQSRDPDYWIGRGQP